MKKLRLLALLLVATVPFAACGDDEPSAPETGGIQGTVVVESAPLSGVTVAISGPQSATTTTDANGQYSFASIPSGNYTVEIAGGAPDDVTFASVSKSAAVQGGQTATVDFSGDYIRTAVISGRVVADTEDGEANVANIPVMLSGTESRETNTDQSGNFRFEGLRAGTYTVSIDVSGLDIEFNTTSQQVNVSVGGSANVEFTGLQTRQAHVTINTITTAGGVQVNRGNVAGIIYVNLNVDPGSENVSRVSVALNDEEVASQDVSISSGSSAAAAAAQETVQFQINTAMFDPQTLEVAYPNGNYELSATVETEAGTMATATLGQPLVFNNADVLRVVRVDGNSVVSGGVRWYGGSDQTFRAEAILYSDQVTINEIGVTGARPAAPGTNGLAGIDLGSGAGTEHLISGPAPFEFTMAQSDNSPASPGVAGGVEDPGGAGGMSTISITSVNDPDGVDIIGAFGTNTTFTAPFDFTAPVVNTLGPGTSAITVAATNPPGGTTGITANPGTFFSGGGFSVSNTSELGIGGPNFTFDVDDGATATDPDYAGAGGIGAVNERGGLNLTTEVVEISDNLGNTVALATNPVDGGNNTSGTYNVDKGAPAVTNVLPAPGTTIVLNYNTAANDLSFSVADPALADGNAGSGYNTTAAGQELVVVNNQTAATTTIAAPGWAAGANTIETDGTGPAFPAAPNTDGNYTVTMTNSDNAVSFNQTTTVWNVILDGTAPTTNMLNPPAGSVTSSNATLTFTIQGNAADANGLGQVLVNVRDDDAGDGDDICELTDPLVPTGSNPGDVNRNSVDVTANAGGFATDITIYNESGAAQPRTVCFFIEASDNAKDVNGNPDANTSNQSAKTDITWN